MKWVMVFLGILLLIAGLLWAGQGAGLIMWPSSSFMLQESEWMLYGGLTALVGLALIYAGSRRAY